MRVRVNFIETGICATTINGARAVYNFNKINRHPNGNALLYLWATERYKITGIIPPEAANITTPAQSSGRPMLKAYRMTLEEYGPISENDTVFIFKSYLDDHFPNGGILCFEQPEYYRGLARHDIPYTYTLFINDYYEYITESRHKSHPLVHQHIAWIENPKFIRYFMVNLSFLRQGIEVMTENVKVD